MKTPTGLKILTILSIISHSILILIFTLFCFIYLILASPFGESSIILIITFGLIIIPAIILVISTINLLLLKKWARLTTIITSIIHTLILISGLIYSGEPNWKNTSAIIYFIIIPIIIIILNITLTIYLTRPKIKKYFIK
jgi:O-antigen ligase